MSFCQIEFCLWPNINKKVQTHTRTHTRYINWIVDIDTTAAATTYHVVHFYTCLLIITDSLEPSTFISFILCTLCSLHRIFMLCSICISFDNKIKHPSQLWVCVSHRTCSTLTHNAKHFKICYNRFIVYLHNRVYIHNTYTSNAAETEVFWKWDENEDKKNSLA